METGGMEAEEADDDIVELVVESLLGDKERTGELTPADLARIASKRQLSPEQIDLVVLELKSAGVEIDDPQIPADDAALGGTTGQKDLLKFPPVTPEDERSLARTYAAGRQLEGNQAEQGSASPHREVLIRQGRKAREKLILHNLRLVAWAAKDYGHYSVDFEDVFQEGLFGLFQAVERFDPALGYRFSTYALWWIHQSIQRNLDNTQSTIRIPIHRLTEIRKLRRTKRLLIAENGREPTLDQLASALDWTLEQTAYVSDLEITRFISLDAPASETGSSTIGDLIPDLDLPSPEQITILADLQETIASLLRTLTPRQERVLRLRFGIGVVRNHTLEEIGSEFGLTRERIRQLEARALERLRHPARRRILTTFKD
ncbi:sigma-70 family RNA polymerase sigma factor [Microvirga sp. CF3016]|uniref:sigma-70 family RNA polymerase sigma factor n=1 Tax=Microvirga sp. CF3016 TaxID=3110181 RepID=UPI002E75FD63|nr:RNA polymerase sigma factor RpoD/SigA [Microvirga sp. CF3016]MEE1611863.1 RNA polymerase sigma factor RpoD/SigA [Microvirga sp. CF3016]